MSFIESLYESDRIFDGFKRNQNFGISPRPITAIILNGVNSLKFYFTVNQTVIENASWCEVKGVLVRIKMGSAPTDIYDGDFVGDYTGSDLTSHAIGSNNPIIINGLTNFSTYYVRFFPYSVNDVFSFSESNIFSGIPKDVLIYGFHQNFLDLNPDTTITYLNESVNFGPMISRQRFSEGVLYTDGGWSNWDWLQENLPYMVRKTGIKDYALDPNDYTKKLDGSASDISNASYDGGAFAWLPKLYMKEVYAADGNSRDVYFARSNTGLYTSDFYPVGFVDPSNQVMEGVWLPMFYMGSENLSLNDTTIYKTSLSAFNNYINDFSTRGRFLGGPLMNLLRDVMYMIYRNTNLQKYAGYGWSGANYDSLTNPKKNKLFPFNGVGRDPNQGRFNGSGIGFDESGTVTGYQFDKAFHSNVFSYAYGLLDPYLGIYKEGIIPRIYILTNYNMSPFGDFTNYQLLSYSPSTGTGDFRTKLIKLDPKFGSIPDGTSPLGSNITGLCDSSGSFRGGSTGSATYCSRLMYTNNGKTIGYPGVGNIYDGIAYGDTNDYRSAAMLLLPEIGYSPT